MGNIISSLLEQAGPMAQILQQATGMAQAIQTGNPINMLSQADPRMKQVLDYINSNGGDPENAFYALAKQKGADPQEYLKQAEKYVNGNRQ